MSESIFIWEDESWEFANSDNLRKTSDENQEKKSPQLEEELAAAATNSNCPTPNTAEPAPSAAITTTGSKKRSKNSTGGEDEKARKKKVLTKSEQEAHIRTERERRKRMRDMFDNLHAMLPQLPLKADKSSVVDEAVVYIKTLEQTLEKLEKKKQVKLHGIIDSSFLKRSRISMDNSSREAFLADYHQGTAAAASIIPSVPNYLPGPSTNSGGFPTEFTTWVSPNVVLSITGDNAYINVCCHKKIGLFTTVCYFLEKHNLEVVSFQASSDTYRSMCIVHAKPSGAVYEIGTFEENFQRAAVEITTYITSIQ